MSCNFPVGTYDRVGNLVYRPCGGCRGCRLGYSRDWQVRLYHEGKLHDESDFITLTYNDKNLPKDKSVDSKEMEKFIRRIKYNLDKKKIRYYIVGEYGTECKNCKMNRKDCFKKGCGEYVKAIGRPHYHAIIFGHRFTDKELLFYRGGRKGTGGYPVYRSNELERYWKKGFSTTADFTEESAGYVARYSTKKIRQSEKQKIKNGDKVKEWYGERKQECALMSRNPGIGHDWYKKYKTDCFPKDFVTIKGKKYPIPRYYYYLLEKESFPRARSVLRKRRERAWKKEYEDSWRGKAKEECLMAKTSGLNRRLENG